MRFDAKQVEALLQRPFVCTVVHTISWDEVHDEGRRIEAALRAGGYADADRIEMTSPARDVLVAKLLDILLEHEISGWRVSQAIDGDVGIVVTVDFKDTKDAVLFKLALP